MLLDVTFPYIYILNVRIFIQGFCGVDSKSFKEEFDKKKTLSIYRVQFYRIILRHCVKCNFISKKDFQCRGLCIDKPLQ
jgi:hypothetical protein